MVNFLNNPIFKIQIKFQTRMEGHFKSAISSHLSVVACAVPNRELNLYLIFPKINWLVNISFICFHSLSMKL